MVSDGWTQTTLGAIADKRGYGLVDGPFGSNLPASEYTNAGVPVIRGSNLSLSGVRFNDSEFVFVSEETAQRLNRSLCRAGDIVFTKKGTLGQTGFVPKHPQYQKFLLSSNQMKLTVDREIADPLFVYYYVSSPWAREKLVRDSEMTGVPKTNTAYLREFPILLPPLLEQQAIACILGALDDKVELNRRMNQTLEGIARAIFKSWFVDFDPVHAKSAGQQPSGLASYIADLFPDAFEASELGEIPKGWEVHTLPDILDINPRRQLPRGTLAPYLAMSEMPTQGHAPDAWIEREVGSGMKFQNGDTLVARITPCLENGKTAYIDFLNDGEVGWGSTEYIVLRPQKPVPEIFAYLLARSEEFRTFAIQQMTGSSGRQRVPANSLTQYETVIPAADSPVFTAFGQAVNPLFERIRSGVEQSRTLAALRDTLLPRLISGELRVPDAEQFVEDAL